MSSWRVAGAVATMAMVATVLVISGPGSVRSASAQVECVASSQAEFNDCIGIYNAAGAGSRTTISLVGNIEMSSPATDIDNGTGAQLAIQGNGFSLTAASAFPAISNLLEVVAGEVAVTDLTVSGATLYGLLVRDGATTISASTLAGNGGGLFAGSPIPVVVTNSTIADNTGDGIGVGSSDSVTLVQSTVVDNGGFGIEDSFANSTITGSLIAGNNGSGTGSECNGGTITDGGGNIVDDATCGPIPATPAVAETYAATRADNGCSTPCTQTVALLAGSPAIDAAGTCTVATDQRGVARPAGACDAGAFEAGDCVTNALVGTDAELKFAIGCYNAALAGSMHTITFTSDIDMADETEEIVNETGAELVIDGAGRTLRAGNAFSGDDLLRMEDGIVDIVDLTVTGASLDGFNVQGGSASVTGSTFTNNGLGLFAGSRRPVVVTNSTFASNDSDAIFVSPRGEATVTQSTIVDNGGFAVVVLGARVTLTGSLLSGNDGDDSGAECNEGSVTDGGGNVVDDSTCGSIPATPDVAGTYADTLADNGCSTPCTQTVALLAGSPAINAAGSCGIAQDQRGEVRPAGSGCDAGAFELQGLPTCDDKEITIFWGPGAVATSGNDVIWGTGADDVIDALGGDDTICAGDGDDRVIGGPGADVILGEDGDDKLFGRQGHDEIHGGPGADTIHGNRGDDTLFGGDDDDRIFGYAHNDVIDGGDGNDRLHGNFGNDTVSGGLGDDDIFGYGDDDTLSGGAGNDLISGNFGDDEIDGGSGDDVLFGADGHDVVNGGPGNDEVNGNSLNDILNGGSGNDVLDGGINVDVCNGNAGADSATRCETVSGIP